MSVIPLDDSAAGFMSKAAVAARLTVGAVLVISGFSKVMIPVEEFAMVLEGYQLFPLPMLMVLARVLPWVELFAGACLFLGVATGLAGVVATALFIGFIMALGSTLVRGVPVEDCGCFGWGLPHLHPAVTIVMDAGLLVLCILVLVDRERLFSLERWLRKMRTVS
jgi:uncharacterized membrane protein YphA (DoxX/SURF4 family)